MTFRECFLSTVEIVHFYSYTWGIVANVDELENKHKTIVPALLLPYLLPLRLTVPLLLLETGPLLNPKPGSTSILTPCPPESSLLLPLLAGLTPAIISISLSRRSTAASTFESGDPWGARLSFA